MTALDRPILVTGTPRSGKSILLRVMGAATEFHCVQEPLLVWNSGSARHNDDRRTAADATSAVRSRIRSDCQGMVERAGRQRYIDDLAYHALRIPFAREVMPEARIIHIVRGPELTIPELLYGWTYRDTVGKAVARRWRTLRLRGLPAAAMRFARNYISSRAQGRRATWGPTPPGLLAFAADHAIAEVAAFQWRRMIEIAREDLAACPPAAVLHVRLERLLADPRVELERVIAFVEPEKPAAVLEHGLRHIDPNHTFEKKVHPTPSEWERIFEQIAPLRQRLERELEELQSPAPGDPAGVHHT